MAIKNFLKNVFARIGIVLIVITIILVAPWAVQANCDPVNIMPLGDSITFGQDGTYGGYRGYLYDLLNSAGYDFDFIGSRPDFDVGTAPSDTDHEGWPGWKADQIRDHIYNGLDNQNNGLNWLETASANPDQGPVDIVLLHIGTNDISGLQNPSDIALEIGQILDEIDEYEAATSSEVWVILARIISRTDSKASQTATLNNEIQILADARIAAGDKIIVVDMENGAGIVYDTTTGDMDDSVHPVDSGYEKIANTWFAVLDNFLPGYCASESAEEFTIVVLPDTQKYSDNYPEIFQAQTQWIVDNKDTLNIVYVAHEGDIVDHADDASEWINADNAMSLLDVAMIPYGVVPGNHDEPTTFYNQYFGVDRFCNSYPTDCRSYYGDGYPFGSNDNNYTLFTAGGMDFIVINLEYVSPAAGALDWADQLLKDHSDRRAIVVSHYILNSNATFSSWGQQIYDALSDNPNPFLMLCGHIHAEARRTDGKLHTLLADYQDYPNGGNGFLRIMHFAPEANEIRVKTYSPELDQYETDPNSQFTLSYDMGGMGSSEAIINFQDGLSPDSGYFGTRDTVLSQNDPSINYGGDIALYVDGDDPSGSGTDLSTLLYWDISAIPAGSIIHEVSLTLNVFNASNDSYQVHEMKRDWVESESTWNLYSSTNGWEIPGALGLQDRGDVVLGSFSPTGTGAYVINLNSEGMALVQAWVDNPTSNHGFIIANGTATDGADFDGREALTANNRPKLAVRYSEAQPINHPPMAHDQLVSTDEGALVSITLTGSDSDGDTLSFTVVSGPTNGTLNGTAPDLIYTPNPDYTGGDSFMFMANDGEADSNIATVTVTVNPTGSLALEIDTDFDSGSILSYNIEENTVNITLKTEQMINTGEDYTYWTNFKLANVLGEEITLNFIGIDSVPFLVHQGPQENQMVYSCDGETWNRFTQYTYTSNNDGTYTVAETFLCNEAQIATFFPFSYQRMMDYVDRVSLSEWVTVTVLGSSLQGRSIDLLTITNTGITAENKDQIYIIGRQHAAETTSSHMLEGMIDFLISDDPDAQKMRDNFVWYIVPIVNPDGVWNGNSRGTYEHIDPNRQWGNDETGEVNIVRDNIEQIDNEYAIEMFIDWHNQMNDVGWYNFVYSPPDNTFFSVLSSWTDFDQEKALGTSCSFQSCSARGYATEQGLFTFVLEPTPHLSTWTRESLKQEGINTAYAIADYFGAFQIDPDSPEPDPMTWATAPSSAGSSSISMTATTASDENGVEYYFMCTAGGCQDSGWQDSAIYEDTGLQPGIQYTYQVKARDKSVNQNETNWSNTASATTENPNTDPVGSGDSASTNEDTAVTIDVLENDSDVNGDTLVVESLTQPTNGNVVNNGSDVTYTPAAEYCGTDGFTYMLNDGNGGTDTATVDVTVTCVNDTPVADGQAVSTRANTSVDITLSASDVDGDLLTYSVVTGPENGDLSGSGADLTYTPDADFNGDDSFTFVANDGEVDSNIATVSISVTYGSYALSFDGDDDLVRAGEVPGTGPLTVEAWLNPNDGNADGLVIVGTEGVDGWVIQISSGRLTWWLSTNQGWQNTQHATLLQAGQWYHIAATYDNGSARTFINGVASIATSVGTLTQGPSLTIGGFGGYFFNGMIDEVRISNNVRYTSGFVPPTGSFALDANTLGLWHFDEGEGQIAADASSSANHCTLGNTNQNDGTDPIWVDSYLFENNAPVADDLIATTEKNTAVAIILSGSDLDGDPLTYIVASGPSSGTLSGTAPELTYTPDADFTGIDSFTYIANDGTDDSDEATVTITVNLENQAPIVEAGPAQTVTLPDSASLDGTVTDDGLPAGSILTTTWSMQSGPGTVTFGNSAAVDTTASFSDDGTYVLKLEATDGDKSAFDEVTITVNPDEQPPSPNPTWATAPYATGTSSISMTATTVSDPSGVEYYFEELSGTSGGSDSGWQDSASFTDTGLSADTTFTYRVRARDKSAKQNQTAWSSELSATTDVEAPKSGCGTAPMYRDSGRANLSASNSVGNALLPLLPSMMALGLWRVKRAGRSRKKDNIRRS